MATEAYQLNIQGDVNGQYRENVIHFKGVGLTADDTFASGKALIDSWYANAKSLWLACMPGSYSLDRLTARRVSPPGSQGPTRQFQYFTEVGTFSGLSASFNLCPSIFLVPPMGTKSGNRVFMPCVPVTGIISNAYQTPYLTALDNLFVAMTTGWTASGITWSQCIWSRKLGAFHDISTFTPSNRLGFQGRRRSPVGT